MASTKKAKYHGLSLPSPLIEDVKKHIETRPSFTSVADFVRFAVRTVMRDQIKRELNDVENAIEHFKDQKQRYERGGGLKQDWDEKNKIMWEEDPSSTKELVQIIKELKEELISLQKRLTTLETKNVNSGNGHGLS